MSLALKSIAARAVGTVFKVAADIVTPSTALTFTTVRGRDYDVQSGTPAPTLTNYAVDGIITTYSEKDVDGVNFIAGDEQVLVKAIQLAGVTPSTKDTFTEVTTAAISALAEPGTPTKQRITVLGGDIADGSLYAWRISLLTAQGGETLMSAMVEQVQDADFGADSGYRIVFPTLPAGASLVRVWRSLKNDDSDFRLRATIAASVPYFDDSLSYDRFTYLNVPLPPTLNTTAVAAQTVTRRVVGWRLDPTGSLFAFHTRRIAK